MLIWLDREGPVFRTRYGNALGMKPVADYYCQSRKVPTSIRRRLWREMPLAGIF
jgi:hypothetical protein